MRSRGLLLVAAMIVGCSSSKPASDAKPPGGDAVGESAAHDSSPLADSSSCPLKYVAAGCQTQAVGVCDDGRGGACGGAVCDCQGSVHLTSCDHSDVPFAYRIDPAPLLPAGGGPCDLNPDAKLDTMTDTKPDH